MRPYEARARNPFKRHASRAELSYACPLRLARATSQAIADPLTRLGFE